MATQPNKSYRVVLTILGLGIVIELALLFRVLMTGKTISLLQPAGHIAEQQRDLIVFAAGLSLLVILPVFGLLFFILWRYRDGNVRAKYSPNWDSNRTLETIWWGIPMAIILVLAIVTWNTSHSLDPYRPISDKRPLTVQVIALQWKWLFIYPEQNIATVNYLQVPEDTPIEFRITSDAPMNSFWIPQLGGQVYAMPGMETKLHLMADGPGVYDGLSSNISGEGFSGMKFTVHSVSNQEFNSWVQTVWKSPDSLSQDTYNELVKPSKNDPVTLFASRDQTLYGTVLGKYMGSHGSHSHKEAY